MRSPAWLIREGDFEYVTIYVLQELTRNIDLAPKANRRNTYIRPLNVDPKQRQFCWFNVLNTNPDMRRAELIR